VVTRTRVVKIDDLDGKDLDGDANAIAFSVRGVDYTIDLSDKNAEKFDKALEPFVNAAQKVGGRRLSRRGKALNPPGTLHAVREWGKAQGLKVSDRGRVSREVRDAYEAAH
jgi:hypothetical protein